MLGRTNGLADAARSADVAGIARARGLRLKGRVNLTGPCPHCGGTDRFAISVSKQAFHCRGCGAAGYGAISFVTWLDGCAFKEAVREITGEPVKAATDHSDHEQRRHQKAAWLWQQRRPVEGTIVVKYLRDARGYAGPLPPTLGFLPETAKHPPAMVACFGICDEPEPGLLAVPAVVTAVHITALLPDGSGKADIIGNKRVVGSPLGQPIVVAPINDGLALTISEGIEDALSAFAATGCGSWAAYSAGNMPKLADLVPDYVESVTIFSHPDVAGQRGALELAAKLCKRCEVRYEN